MNDIFLMLGGENGQSSPLPTFIFMGAIFLVMYFFMIRPQQKKASSQKKFMEQIKKGDKIVTIGGIHGKVMKVNESSLLIEVDGATKLKVEKSAVSMDLTKAAVGEQKPEEEAAPKA